MEAISSQSRRTTLITRNIGISHPDTWQARGCCCCCCCFHLVAPRKGRAGKEGYCSANADLKKRRLWEPVGASKLTLELRLPTNKKPAAKGRCILTARRVVDEMELAGIDGSQRLCPVNSSSCRSCLHPSTIVGCGSGNLSTHTHTHTHTHTRLEDCDCQSVRSHRNAYIDLQCGKKPSSRCDRCQRSNIETFSIV